MAKRARRHPPDDRRLVSTEPLVSATRRRRGRPQRHLQDEDPFHRRDPSGRGSRRERPPHGVVAPPWRTRRRQGREAVSCRCRRRRPARVIAPRTGVAVVAGALLGQSVRLADRRGTLMVRRRVRHRPSRPPVGGTETLTAQGSSLGGEERPRSRRRIAVDAPSGQRGTTSVIILSPVLALALEVTGRRADVATPQISAS